MAATYPSSAAQGAAKGLVLFQEALEPLLALDRELIDSIADSIKVIGLDGRVVSISKGAQHLLEIDQVDAYLGRPWLELWEGEGSAVAGAALEKARSGERARFQASRRTARGRDTWWDVQLSPVLDGRGRPRQLLAVSRDMTELKQTERALRKSEQQLREALEAGRMLAFDWDVASDAVERSVSAADVFGMPHTQNATAATFFDTVYPEDRPQLAQAIEAARGNGGQYHAQYRIRLEDGSTMWVEDMGQAEFDEKGRLRRVHGLGADITERKRAEEELHHAHQRLQYHIQNTPLAVINFDAEWRVIAWNDGAQRIFGWAGLEVIGKGVWEIPWVHPDDLEKVRRTAADMTERQVRRTISPNRNVRKDGSIIWCEWYNSSLTDEAGKMLSIQSLVLDVTQRQQAEEALRRTKEAAEAANKAKDHFLAVLSHELRTPLTPALMAATILENNPQIPEEVRQDVGVIRRNVELEARLIDDLLDLTRIARGKLILARRIMDGREVLRHAIETCQADAVEKKLELRVTMADEVIEVDADPARLQQVFWNLLKNAIKFTPEGGQIAVTAMAGEPGGLRVEVSDTGRGIEKSALERIFDAFEQGGTGVTQRFGGLGLGLAICKGLVTVHDGMIRAWSEGPGKGATFVVELPPARRPEVLPGSGGTGGEHGGPARRKCRILLVEDHAGTAVMLARLLRSFGHQVTVAECISSAVLRFEAEQFDLVISDLGLPDGSGQGLLRQLLAKRPVKAIALSGYGMEADVRQSIEAGFMEHLVKPVNARQIEDAISRVTG